MNPFKNLSAASKKNLIKFLSDSIESDKNLIFSYSETVTRHSHEKMFEYNLIDELSKWGKTCDILRMTEASMQEEINKLKDSDVRMMMDHRQFVYCIDKIKEAQASLAKNEKLLYYLQKNNFNDI